MQLSDPEGEFVKTHVVPEAPTPAGNYSHAVEVGNLVFLAGQAPYDPATGDLAEGFTLQAEQVFKNLTTVSHAVGCTLSDAVSVRVFLSSMTDFAEFNEIYAKYIGSGRPVRTTVQSDIPFLIEVDAILERGD